MRPPPKPNSPTRRPAGERLMNWLLCRRAFTTGRSGFEYRTVAKGKGHPEVALHATARKAGQALVEVRPDHQLDRCRPDHRHWNRQAPTSKGILNKIAGEV